MDPNPVLVQDDDGGQMLQAVRAAVDEPVIGYQGADPAQRAAATILLAWPAFVADVAATLPSLRWVQSMAAGVAPLLPWLETRPDIVVTGVRGVFGPLMAEYVLGWLCALERRLPEYLALQEQRGWARLPARSLRGRRMAVLGLGDIGRHVARVARSFGIHVVGVTRGGRSDAAADVVHPADRIVTAVAGADYLVSVLPDTVATRGLVDAEVLGALARDAIFVNVGRGTVLDDDALLAALATGALQAAVLDVFREEPLPAEHPFWTTPGVHVTPHVSAPSLPEDIAAVFAANLARWRRGRPLADVVDPARGY